MSETKRHILIADPSAKTLEMILRSPQAASYEIETARSGPECLDRLNRFKPDLLLVELMLPEMHAIEILDRLGGRNKMLGVFITSAQTMIQNHRAAIERGADDYLQKPFTAEDFFARAEAFFQGNLKAQTYIGPEITKEEAIYHPIPTVSKTYLKFWGTRGSNPVSGPKYIRYGGNTCCLEVRYGDDHFIIDAGTGIRPLGEEFQINGELNLFIGHTHWDHITGFPFFQPIYKNTTKINVYAPVGFDRKPKAIFTEMLAHAFFPVRLDDILADLTFKEIRDGDQIHIGKLTLEMHYAYHPGDTLCFKIKSPHHTVGYVTDNEVLMGYHGHPKDVGKNHPLLEPHKRLITFLRDCDTIVHEAQYFPEEYRRRVGWGHSSISNAAAFIAATGCKNWIITHHDPQHSDRDLQVKVQLLRDILNECRLDVQVRMAYDGLMLPF